MPELPEVETMRRGLLPAVGGVIRSIEFPNFGYRPIAISPQPDQWPEMLSGKTITAIDRIAKRVVVRIDDGHRIV